MIRYIFLYLVCGLGTTAEWMKEHPKKTLFLITIPLCIIPSRHKKANRNLVEKNATKIRKIKKGCEI